jgi:hypothetical protein
MLKKMRNFVSAVLCCIAAAFMPKSAAEAVNEGNAELGDILGGK